jgi:hypothetical protein
MIKCIPALLLFSTLLVSCGQEDKGAKKLIIKEFTLLDQNDMPGLTMSGQGDISLDNAKIASLTTEGKLYAATGTLLAIYSNDTLYQENGDNYKMRIDAKGSVSHNGKIIGNWNDKGRFVGDDDATGFGIKPVDPELYLTASIVLMGFLSYGVMQPEKSPALPLDIDTIVKSFENSDAYQKALIHKTNLGTQEALHFLFYTLKILPYFDTLAKMPRLLMKDYRDGLNNLHEVSMQATIDVKALQKAVNAMRSAVDYFKVHGLTVAKDFVIAVDKLTNLIEKISKPLLTKV